MRWQTMFRSWVAIVSVVASLLSGCATIEKSPAPESERAKVTPGSELPNGWWYVRFKMKWPEGKEPSWYMDPLLAKEVVAPVLFELQQGIALWRFHRRASRDRAGHQFSFIFYASPATASAVYDRIRSDGTLQVLKKAGAVIADSYDDTNRVTRPHIQDTSDPHWSLDLQKSWPYFIMGVSRTWLELIELQSAKVEKTEDLSSFEDLKAEYTRINAAIDQLWQREGGHAFLHHLNAIFGYVPVQFYEKRTLSF